MTGCESDQFERRSGTVDQRVHDGNGRGFDPLPKNLVVLKTREREFDHRGEVFHAGRERLGESVSQVASLANDGLSGIIWKTDGGLPMVRGVAKIYFRVGRIREGRCSREEREIPFDARCWHGGGSAGSNQGTHELPAVHGRSFSSRNPNRGMRPARALSES